MKQLFKSAGTLALLAASAMAQSQVGVVEGSNYNPVNTMWWIFTLIYGTFGAVMGISILYHCMHGALGSHDGMGKIINVLQFAAIGFGVVFIISRMTLGAQAPI
jgi:hypothetical protein